MTLRTTKCGLNGRKTKKRLSDLKLQEGKNER